MILVDANLLVYAYMDGVPQHRAAKAWLEERFADTSEIGLPWAALAIEHDLTLCSADRGFRKFADLRWENPLD